MEDVGQASRQGENKKRGGAEGDFYSETHFEAQVLGGIAHEIGSE